MTRQPTEGAAAKWKPIGDVFGEGLVHDVRHAIDQHLSGYGPRNLDRSARRWFLWVASEPSDPKRRALLGVYDSTRISASSPPCAPEVIHVVTECFNRFCDELPAMASISGANVWKEQRCAALVLERLGQARRQYPSFLIALHQRKRGRSHTPLLGHLPISDDIDMPPGAARERKALDKVGRLALHEFRDHAEMIELGSAIRSGVTTAESSDARDCIRSVLLEAWSKLPARRSGRRLAKELVTEAPEAAMDPRVWVAAGFPERCIIRFAPAMEPMSRATVGWLSLACLGPSPTMIVSGAAVVSRGRGWNKSPILEIPADPFLFTFEGSHGVANGFFVAALKERAGHPVVMFLDGSRFDGAELPQGLLEDWRATVAAADGNHVDDQMLLGVDPDDQWGDAILEVFHTLMRVSKPLRAHDPIYGAIDRLFAFPPLNARHKRNFEGDLNLAASTTHALAMGKVTFPSIRASWVVERKLQGRSLTDTMVDSGKVTSAATLHDYLNHLEIGADLRKPLKFFMSICEAIIVRSEVVALRLGLAPADHDRLLRLARASGMAAAFGIGLPQVGPTPVLRFVPNDGNLRDLFLSLWALRMAARTLPPAIWRVRCLELFAAARAIAAELVGKGLARIYAEAARKAYADHRAGLVSLPRVEGA